MIELLYDGPPSLVSALAQMLGEEGLDVSFEPLVEHRGIGHDDAGAVIVYVVTKPLDKLVVDPLIDKAVARFHARFKGAAEVTRQNSSLSDGSE